MNMRYGSGKTFNEQEWKNEYRQAVVDEWLNYDKPNSVLELGIRVTRKTKGTAQI